MRLSKSLLLIILLAAILSPAVRADCKIKAPNKSGLEEMFGKPIDTSANKGLARCVDLKSGKQEVCRCDSGEYVCYEKNSIEVLAKFNFKNRAEKLEIYTDGSDIYEPQRIAIRLIFGTLSEETWKKYSKILKRETPRGGQPFDKYEDDCLTLTQIFGNEEAAARFPVFISISWKK